MVSLQVSTSTIACVLPHSSQASLCVDLCLSILQCELEMVSLQVSTLTIGAMLCRGSLPKKSVV